MPIGDEYVQRKMLKQFNLTDTDWLPGPAFLSWARMGNLQRWAGPPSGYWIDKQKDLAKTILNRMVNDFGMEPVLPAFAGFLPTQFLTKYPNSDTQQFSQWAGFNCSYSGLPFFNTNICNTNVF